jgi:serine/threonine-protein kinase
MELVDGVPLSRLLRDEGMEIPAVTYVARELAQALDFIHNRIGLDGSSLGLVHRDLNPPNVLISRHGEVKLADFGVAKASAGSNLTAAGMLVGKLNYMAPEQLRGDPYDGRADMFALGLTLYELVAGHRAVRSTSEVAILKELLDGTFEPPSHSRADIPAPLDDVIVGLLNRDPQHRTTATALRDKLAALAGPANDVHEGRRLLAAAVARAQEEGEKVAAPTKAKATNELAATTELPAPTRS